VRALFVAVDGRGLAHERRIAWAAGALLFVFLGAHTVLEVARDALFLTHLAADELPLTYLGLAGLVTVASQLDARLSRRLDDRWALATTLGAGALGALVFRGLFGLDEHWVPHGFYLWTGCIASLAVAQFWRLGAGLFTVASAKRFFGPIGAGGALGAPVGEAPGGGPAGGGFRAGGPSPGVSAVAHHAGARAGGRPTAGPAPRPV